MAWPHYFSGKDDNTCTAWGYTFRVTPAHLTKDDTEKMKMSYDTLGEAAWERLKHFVSPPTGGSKTIHESEDRQTSGIQEPANPVPGRKDLFLLLRDHAQQDDVLGQFWTEVSTVPPWGAARVVETLSRTGGFSTHVARRRLFETTQHILQCTKDLSSIQPGGPGHASTIRVRLLHAAVRQRIVKLARKKPDYYDVEKFGVPINDLDSTEEIEDYIALFRYIAYLTGTPNEYFESPARAKTVMETLLRDEIQPSATSRILANNILSCLEDQPPTFASRPFLEANCRAFRRIIWSVIVEDGQGLGQESVFEFKYIPDLSKTTKAEKSRNNRTKRNGVEKRNLRALVLGCIAITIVLFVVVRMLMAISTKLLTVFLSIKIVECQGF
ncbi:MAG: hypothetical protein Q9222_000260 [Ikaeria aurantiellina]